MTTVGQTATVCRFLNPTGEFALLSPVNVLFAIVVVAFCLLCCEQALAQKRAVISFDGVKIYALPLRQEAPLTVLGKGDIVRVIGQRGDWVKIEFAPGKKGWMLVQARKKLSKPEVKRAPLSSLRSDDGRSTARSPDRIRRELVAQAGNQPYRRFGYAFGMGMLETDFTYHWKFVFHQTRRLAFEGSFRHALGSAANSYLLMANWSYLLQQKGRTLPYVTAGMGVVNTVPERSIDIGGVSHMAINAGIGVRKFFRKNITLMFGGAIYTIFVGKGIRNFKEINVGFIVGKFWD